MNFIKVTSNCNYYSEIDNDGNEIPGKFCLEDEKMTQVEIIPVENLLKIYRYLPDGYILVYVFKDPSTGSVREFKEMFMSEFLYKSKMEYLEKYLCGKETKYD